MEKARCGGVAALLFCAASVAWADDPIYQRLEDLYQKDAGATEQYARQLLAHPEKLTATDLIVAHSYLCEVLDDQDRFDDVLKLAQVAVASVPAKPTSDQVEFSARLLTCVGFAAKQKQRFAEAMTDLNRAVAIILATGKVDRSSATDLTLPLSYALYRRAGLHDTLGDHPAALADLTMAMRVLPEKPDKPGPQEDLNLASQRMNIASAIGRIHMHRQEYDQAATAYEDVLHFTQQTKDEHAEAVIQLNLGECYRGLQRWQDAQQAYARALTLGTGLKDQVLVGRAHAGLGALARSHRDYSGALSHFALAHTELAEANAPLEQGKADLERAQTLADMHDWQQLSTLANQLVASLTAIGDKRLLNRALDLRARAAEGQGDMAAALADTRREVVLQDEIQRSELEDELAKRNVQFEVAKLDDRTRLLARENELARLQIEHDRDVSLIQRAAIVIAIGIALLLSFSIFRRIRIQRLLTRFAQEDALTGLRNRRAALAAANDLFDASRRSGTPLSLALFDIDHFKRINDSYGHAAGDAVLVAVAACLRESMRTDDICGRVGGEEFLFVFPRCDTEQAAKLLEQMRAAVAALRFSVLPAGHTVTFSAGLTRRNPDDTLLDTLVRRADAALYEAKNSGRDRVVVDAAQAV